MKSSIDYVELQGLRVALSNLSYAKGEKNSTVIEWIKNRIKTLENK